MSHNEDLRVRRTRKLLTEAFMEMVVEQGYPSVTVQGLAQRAMINRATFYRHYRDIEELADHVYDSMGAEYADSVQAVESLDPRAAWRLLFEHLGAHGRFYREMVASAPRFRDLTLARIERQMHDDLLRFGLDEQRCPIPAPVALRYLASAQMGVVQWWLDHEQPIPAEEMADHLLALQLNGVERALNLPRRPT